MGEGGSRCSRAGDSLAAGHPSVILGSGYRRGSMKICFYRRLSAYAYCGKLGVILSSFIDGRKINTVLLGVVLNKQTFEHIF